LPPLVPEPVLGLVPVPLVPLLVPVALEPVPEPEPVPLMPLDPDRPVPLAPVLPLMPLVPDEPEPVPEVPVPMLPLLVPVPMLPLVPVPLEPLELPVPMLPDEPEVPCISWLPLDDEPLVPPMLEPLLPVEPLLLEPWLELLWCDFFLLCFFVDELPDAPDDWSCGVALVPLVVEPVLVCAWAFTAPDIATVTAAPSSPFSNLFIVALLIDLGQKSLQYQ
jgi:hypothetical protein